MRPWRHREYRLVIRRVETGGILEIRELWAPGNMWNYAQKLAAWWRKRNETPGLTTGQVEFRELGPWRPL